MRFQLDQVHLLLSHEMTALLTSLWFFARGFYAIALKQVSQSRHQSLQVQLRNTRHWLLIFVGLYALYFLLGWIFGPNPFWETTRNYLGFLVILIGATYFIKMARLILLEYLFLTNLRAGVPILIVNIFTLVLSFGLTFWALNFFWNIEIGPLLATSTALSIILGLALQDTLGNLFAGIALQMDHALEIGDWIEIPLNSRSCIGQVHEITWRSTTIIGWFNEIIQVPNRVLANSHLINYKKGEVPIYRSVTFYFPYTADVGQVKNIIKNCVQNLPYIKKDVPINVLVIDQQPQYFTIRVSLPLEDFSMQYHVFNLLFEKTLSEIAQAGIPRPYYTIALHSGIHPKEGNSIPSPNPSIGH